MVVVVNKSDVVGRVLCVVGGGSGDGDGGSQNHQCKAVVVELI